MKKNNLTTKRIGISLAVLLCLTSFVCAIGVTVPQPQGIELKPGQSSYFNFQIQADDFALACVPVIEKTDGLELAFNQKYDVEARQRFIVQPQVIVPQKTGYGSYTATFCIECSPSEEVSGSRIVPRICNLPISVNVVSDRTRENMFDEKPAQIAWLAILVFMVVSILILSSIVFYLIVRKRRAQSA